MKSAVIFPGQGSQTAGMGRKFLKIPKVFNIIDECSSISNMPLRDYILNYSDKELRLTNHAQPAIFALSIGIYNYLIDEGIQPSYFAGHSLGHFSALVASGSIDLSTGIKVVAERGRLMAKVSGFMGVTQNLSADIISQALDESELPLWVANQNLADQIIVSGCKNNLDSAKKIIETLGGKFTLLNVSGAFHSPILRDESETFSKLIESIEINDPSMPIICNSTGILLNSNIDIRENLKKHMIGLVNWVEVMDRLLSEGVSQCIESGPGKVLTGLFIRHNRSMKIMNTTSLSLISHAINSEKKLIEEAV